MVLYSQPYSLYANLRFYFTRWHSDVNQPGIFTNIAHSVSRWPTQRLPWLLLALSASALVGYALYTQHGPQQLTPCVQCIYQRMAMLALALFAWLGVVAPASIAVRTIALFGWLMSAAGGVAIASYHVWLQQAANPLFQPCAPNPDFPAWLPLHEWLPALFAAGGLCGDIDWSLAGLSMPRWLQIIFMVYAVIALLVIILHLLRYRAGKQG